MTLLQLTCSDNLVWVWERNSDAWEETLTNHYIEARIQFTNKYVGIREVRSWGECEGF